MTRIGRIMALLATAFVGGCVILQWRTPTHGWGYSREDCPIYSLPVDAADIDFYAYGYMPNTSFSFQTTEENFHKWCGTLGDVVLQSDRSGTIFYITPDGSGRQVSADDGIEYGWSEEDRGVHTLYDRNTGRAYFLSHTR